MFKFFSCDLVETTTGRGETTRTSSGLNLLLPRQDGFHLPFYTPKVKLEHKLRFELRNGRLQVCCCAVEPLVLNNFGDLVSRVPSASFLISGP